MEITFGSEDIPDETSAKKGEEDSILDDGLESIRSRDIGNMMNTLKIDQMMKAARRTPEQVAALQRPCTLCKKKVPLKQYTETPLVTCSNCKIPYCSSACKKKDLKAHKKSCK